MQEIRIPEPPKWKLATPHHSDANADPSTTTPAATHYNYLCSNNFTWKVELREY